MSSRELHHLRRAVEAAKKIVKKPVIDTQSQDQEPQRRQADTPTNGGQR